MSNAELKARKDRAFHRVLGLSDFQQSIFLCCLWGRVDCRLNESDLDRFDELFPIFEEQDRKRKEKEAAKNG